MIICHLIFTAASCSQIYFYIRVRPPFQFTKMIGSEMSISTDQNRRPHQLPYTFKISREFSSFSNFTLSKVNFDFKSSKCSLIKLKGAILVGSLASEFLGWTWNTNVGIPMLDIGIPTLEFQCPT